MNLYKIETETPLKSETFHVVADGLPSAVTKVQDHIVMWNHEDNAGRLNILKAEVLCEAQTLLM